MVFRSFSGRAGGLAIKAAIVTADFATPDRDDFLGRAADRAATTRQGFQKLKITGKEDYVEM